MHVAMVQKEMARLGLRIHNKTISPSTDLNLPSQLVANKPKLSKPISQQTIFLRTTEQLHKMRLNAHTTIPTAFTPTSHPEFCKCETRTAAQDSPASSEVVCNTRYKAAPEPVGKHSTLWVLHGPPVTDRHTFVWRCCNANPHCDIYYDGNEDAIFNYSNTTLVSHAVLFDFLFGLVTGYDLLSLPYGTEINCN